MKAPWLKRAQRGLTLVELLVVIFITLAITAVAIPVMVPSVEERRQRETSRVVTSHLQGARTRAIQTGKPFGVMLEPQAGLAAASVTLTYMAEAPSWSGDLDSRAHVVAGPVGSPYALLDTFIDDDPMSATYGQPITEYWKGLIRPGDRIRFNGTGYWYVITSGEPFNDVNGNGVRDMAEAYVDLDGDSAYDPPDIDAKGFINSLPWTLTHPDTNLAIPGSGYTDVNMNGTYETPPDLLLGYKFEITRQPTKTAAHPLQLPSSAVVDLTYSGTSGLSSLAGLGPITILFSPSGELKSIYFFRNNLAQSFSPRSPVYLLVGRADLVGTTANYQAAPGHSPFWVTIHPQTGLITSTEVGPDQPEPYADANGNGAYDSGEVYSDWNGNGTWDAADGVVTLSESRYFAERGMALGGR